MRQDWISPMLSKKALKESAERESRSLMLCMCDKSEN